MYDTYIIAISTGLHERPYRGVAERSVPRAGEEAHHAGQLLLAGADQGSLQLKLQ